MKKNLYITLLWAFIAASCVQNKENNDLKSLIGLSERIPNYMEDTVRVSYVAQSLELLQQYAEGKLPEYPAWSVKQAIGGMLGNFAYFHNMEMCDGDICELTETDKYAFFNRYLEQACRLCPDIKMLTSVVSEDEQIGVFDIYSFPTTYYPYSGGDIFSFFVYKDKDGVCQKEALDFGAHRTYKKIYQIDRNNKRYYLMFRLDGYLESLFSLISITDNGLKENLEQESNEITRLMHDISFSEYDKENFPEPEKLVFNSKDLTWKECRQNKNGYWAEFPGSKTFRLVFGDKIKIMMD